MQMRSGGSTPITMPNFLETGLSAKQTYCNFSNFQNGCRRHLGFWNREILLVIGVQRVETHLCATFCQNWSISCEDIRFFDFSRWRPSAILDSFKAYMDHTQWVLGGIYHSAKFGYDRCSSFFIIWTFQYLMRLAGKCLCNPQNCGFGAIWSPKWDAISTKAKKGTPLRESASYEPLSVKMW